MAHCEKDRRPGRGLLTDKTMLCLAIGVGDAVPRKYLTGAINDARRFHKWAKAVGYESRLLTDEAGPLPIAKLRKALEKMLWPDRSADPRPVDRLILYFAGHGLIRGAEEGLWLLSDWDTDQEAAAVEVLKRRLFRFPIAQITIISDCCQDLPADIDQLDLTPDGVIGKGPANRLQRPVDKFVATQAGTSTFMVPGAAPEDDRCIFTGVLLEGLSGTKPEAFSRFRPDVVTGASLGAYLAREVPRISSLYSTRLDPSAQTAFPEGEDVYFDRSLSIVPPALPPWPPKGDLLTMGTGRPKPDDRPPAAGLPASPETSDMTDDSIVLEAIVFEEKCPPDWRPPAAASRPRQVTPLARLPRLTPPPRFPGLSGIGVAGTSVRRIWGPPGLALARIGRTRWWGLDPGQPLFERRDAAPAPILVECSDGICAATVLMPCLLTVVTRDERGVASVALTGAAGPDTQRAARRAILRLEKGGLRANAALGLAVDLRQFKHIDPVLGVISAYLYDAVGDIESIRRMAYYYVENDQPIPYDIALLGLLRKRDDDGALIVDVPTVAARPPANAKEAAYRWTHAATPARTGPVAGRWPWMRQGWAFLEDAADEEATLIAPCLLEAVPELKSGRFTSFGHKGAARLIAGFGLTPVWTPPKGQRE